MLLMGLRLSEGISATRFASRTGIALAEAIDQDMLPALIAEGYLIQEGDRLRATPEGRMRLDAVLGALIR
jgi:oxygen-independent coproporphyrinogen-3 oxidase